MKYRNKTLKSTPLWQISEACQLALKVGYGLNGNLIGAKREVDHEYLRYASNEIVNELKKHLKWATKRMGKVLSFTFNKFKAKSVTVFETDAILLVLAYLGLKATRYIGRNVHFSGNGVRQMQSRQEWVRHADKYHKRILFVHEDKEYRLEYSSNKKDWSWKVLNIVECHNCNVTLHSDKIDVKPKRVKEDFCIYGKTHTSGAAQAKHLEIPLLAAALGIPSSVLEPQLLEFTYLEAMKSLANLGEPGI